MDIKETPTNPDILANFHEEYTALTQKLMQLVMDMGDKISYRVKKLFRKGKITSHTAFTFTIEFDYSFHNFTIQIYNNNIEASDSNEYSTDTLLLKETDADLYNLINADFFEHVLLFSINNFFKYTCEKIPTEEDHTVKYRYTVSKL